MRGKKILISCGAEYILHFLDSSQPLYNLRTQKKKSKRSECEACGGGGGGGGGVMTQTNG